MQSRGPDNSKIVEFYGGCFAQYRLSIIAPSHEYDPPFCSKDSFFVFNGELYNFLEIQKRFSLESTKSDSLCAFGAFSKEKKRFLNEAVGMFAFAMYDKEQEKLFLARDKFGKKPLYYTFQNAKFIFASSLDAITPHITPKFRKSALKSYLSFHATIASETFYEDVYKLPAGCMLTFDGEQIVIESYFDFFEEGAKEADLYDLMGKSVRHRLVADAPLGAFLSGGVDSSAVCALASRMMAESGGRLHTFCVGYDGYEKDDERRFARLTAQKIGSEHKEIAFGKHEFLSAIDRVVAAFDEPISDPAALPLYEMSRVVAAHGFKAVLSGEGGDEAFLGYDKYALMLGVNSAKNLPFASYLGGFFERNHEQNREWEWYRRAFGDEILYRSVGEGFTDEQKVVLLNQKVSARNSTLLIEKYHKEFLASGHSDYSVWMSYIDIKIWLGEVLLQKADKIGMANSLEIRCPLMDSDFLRSAVRLGDSRMSSNPKQILKNLIADMVPSEVLERPKKGFSYPFNTWLFEVGDPEIVLELNKHTQFFHKAPLEFLYNSAKRGKFKHHFWAVYLFSKWYLSRFGS